MPGLKARSDGFNIYFNIRSILLNSDAETVCPPHPPPLSTVKLALLSSQHRSTKSKGCWIKCLPSLKGHFVLDIKIWCAFLNILSVLVVWVALNQVYCLGANMYKRSMLTRKRHCHLHSLLDLLWKQWGKWLFKKEYFLPQWNFSSFSCCD